jgi:hypothetical protein
MANVKLWLTGEGDIPGLSNLTIPIIDREVPDEVAVAAKTLFDALGTLAADGSDTFATPKEEIPVKVNFFAFHLDRNVEVGGVLHSKITGLTSGETATAATVGGTFSEVVTTVESEPSASPLQKTVDSISSVVSGLVSAHNVNASSIAWHESRLSEVESVLSELAGLFSAHTAAVAAEAHPAPAETAAPQPEPASPMESPAPEPAPETESPISANEPDLPADLVSNPPAEETEAPTAEAVEPPPSQQ